MLAVFVAARPIGSGLDKGFGDLTFYSLLLPIAYYAVFALFAGDRAGTQRIETGAGAGDMKRLMAVLVLVCAPVCTFAASSVELLDARVDLDDRASLQRGPKLFVNYCLSCHSLKFMRYNRMGRDLGLTDEQVSANLLFAADKVVEEMNVALRDSDAKKWFGVAPSDLSVIARARSPDWLYSYLVGFYQDTDSSRPFGVNNVVFQDVAMPHVLWSLQGIQTLDQGARPPDIESEHATALRTVGAVLEIHNSAETKAGEHVEVVDKLEVTRAGTLSPGQYRQVARDIVNFLTYVGEPAKLTRYRVGFWVLVYLLAFFALSYSLYKEY